MLIDKYRPLWAPEIEGGAEPSGDEGAPPPRLNERPVDGPGSARGSIRKSLEDAAASFRDKDEGKETPVKDAQTGRFVRGKSRPASGGVADDEGGAEPAATAAEGAVAAAEGGGAEPTAEEAAATAAAAAAAAPTTQPPDGWAADAKAEWAKVPAQVQAAVIKREADVTKGVQELRQRYNDIDQALAPRMDIIRSHGHTPAQAVNQLFSWFEALSAQPAVAFPALAQSFRFDLKSLIEGGAEPAKPADGAAAAGGQPEGEVPAAVQHYIKTLEGKLGTMEQNITQRFGALENTFAQQSQAKTEEILAHWAQGKPHFEEVRSLMAHLIGSGAVPPTGSGQADLDKAYDMALYAMPEVRAQVLAAQQQAADKARKDKETAERTAQQAQADKARKANVSLTSAAPGGSVNAAPGRPKVKGKSVKESLMDSIGELSE